MDFSKVLIILERCVSMSIQILGLLIATVEKKL